MGGIELSSELCGGETKVKHHVTIRTCLHLRKQNTQRMARKNDFPWVHVFCCRGETPLAADSHHWRSFTGSCRDGSGENRFIWEPVKSYDNRNARTHINISAARAERLCTWSKNANIQKSGGHMQRGKETYWVWLISNVFVSGLVLSCKCLCWTGACVRTCGRVLCLHIHPLCLTYFFSLCHHSVDAVKPRWH